SAAGDRRNDRHAGPVRGRGPEALLEAHVVVVDVDVDEAAQLALVVQDAGGDARVVLLQVLDDLGEGRPLGVHLGLSTRVGAQDGRDADGHTHARPASRKESRLGRMVAVRPVPATASRVFRPSPVLRTTVVREGSSRPLSTSLRVTPTVTPPAVSAKMPSVRASSLIASTTCSSVTSSTAPPVRRAMSRTEGPSAGLPMASDLAMVSGFCGRSTSCPALKAAETGGQPAACAPKIL